MTHAIVIHEFGGPEVLSWEEIDVADCQGTEVRLRHLAIGMNMMEIGLRIGAYPGPPLPFVPGVEAIGIVEQVGPDVSEFKVGDRVGYISPPVGSYAEERVYPEHRLFPVPDDIDDKTAAACMVKGMTAEFMLKRSYKVGPGSKVLIHAAAGATGIMCVQLAAHLGAEVFGTVSSEEKAEFARAHGCHHPIVYTKESFADVVLNKTNDNGVDVIYDSVGADTFADSIRALSRFGTLCLFGVASGPPPPLDLMALDLWTAPHFTRPSLYAHTESRQDLLDISANTFEHVRNGILKVEINGEYPLRDAAEVHRAVESRKTTGSLIYLP